MISLEKEVKPQADVSETRFLQDTPNYVYIMQQPPYRVFAPRRDFGRYLSRKFSCLALMAPRRLLRISSTASSYFMPSSISASATNTGALPSPAIQCTAMQPDGSSLNRNRITSKNCSITSTGGPIPSSNGKSRTEIPASCNGSVWYVGSQTRMTVSTPYLFNSSIYRSTVASDGRSVIRNRNPLYSISADSGLRGVIFSYHLLLLLLLLLQKLVYIQNLHKISLMLD